jgi:hypothetical protein
MESFGSTESAQSPGSEVKAYIEQEWTSEGLYCRSENPETGMFEIVLPQISKEFGSFVTDLLACGIQDIEFRADSKEVRLLVYANDSSLIPEYFRRKTNSALWKVAGIVLLFVMVTLTVAVLKMSAEKEL